MINLRVKTKGVRLSFPVPYAILNLCAAIISSKIFVQQVNRWTSESLKRGESEFFFTMPVIDKQALKRIINELKNHRGMVLIDVQTKEGVEVIVKL